MNWSHLYRRPIICSWKFQFRLLFGIFWLFISPRQHTQVNTAIIDFVNEFSSKKEELPLGYVENMESNLLRCFSYFLLTLRLEVLVYLHWVPQPFLYCLCLPHTAGPVLCVRGSYWLGHYVLPGSPASSGHLWLR